jgi:hypothetical protein
VVRDGVIVPENGAVLSEGTRVRIVVAPGEPTRSFGERFAEFKGAVAGLPEDMAGQHNHYRSPRDSEAIIVFVDTFAQIAWLNPANEGEGRQSEGRF